MSRPQYHGDYDDDDDDVQCNDNDDYDADGAAAANGDYTSGLFSTCNYRTW